LKKNQSEGKKCGKPLDKEIISYVSRFYNWDGGKEIKSGSSFKKQIII